MNEELARQFHAVTLANCEACMRLGYNPSYWRRMVLELGAVAATQRLLASADVPSGLSRLWDLHRLDLSAEATALRAEFQPLFTPAELDQARAVLAAYAYTPE